ncbi:MAG: methyltransferase [Pseudomonadota bacterium]|nr:methyltransferase [Pseudomonadota bacterium]
MRYPLVLAASLIASLSLCGTRVQAASIPANITAAIADSSRPEADSARDANRKPAETLVFLGAKPGEKIGELIPGGGYFTRLFSKAVGPKGHVYALVPERPANAPADMPDLAAKVKAIAADPNYSNVSVVVAPLGTLAAAEPVDLVFTSQNYHDLHNFPVDVVAFNKSIFNSLKPGGLYVVLDHSAEAGSGVRDTNTLHRIDADVVKQEVTAAGFKFVGSSDILANSADARTGKVFDPAIRGKTDQFILKFRKPKK